MYILQKRVRVLYRFRCDACKSKFEMTEDEKKQLYAFDYSSLSALRDIKRVFNNRLMDYFTEKGASR